MQKNKIAKLLDSFMKSNGEYIKLSKGIKGASKIAYIPRVKIEDISYSDYGNFQALIYTHNDLYILDNMHEDDIFLGKTGNLIINKSCSFLARK